MADLKNDWQESDIVMNTDMNDIANAVNSKLNSDFSNVSGGAVPIANGGTGATTADDARSNLDVAKRDFSNVNGILSISNGGTGANGYYDARKNLRVQIDACSNQDVLEYIKSLPADTVGYFMANDCTNTPGYNWMLYTILYNGGGNGEWQEILVTAANDNYLYFNFYVSNQWKGWQLIQAKNAGVSFVSETEPYTAHNGDLWAW